VRDTIVERVRAEGNQANRAGSVRNVDSGHARRGDAGGLASEFTAKGIKIQAVEAHSQMRDRLRGEGLGERFGGIERFRTVADVADDFLRGVRQNPDEPVLDRP
jgi:hypothetical protein